jgi:hypothetical protein
MANYKVASDNVAGKKPGDVITEQELEGCNIDALVEAGHIVGETKSSKAEKE